jgi:hypothetical protein
LLHQLDCLGFERRTEASACLPLLTLRIRVRGTRVTF